MKKSVYILFTVLISLISAFYIGVIRFSTENLDNIKEKRTAIEFVMNENMHLDNWDTADGKNYVSTNNDPIIWLDTDINQYVSNIRFKGTLDRYEDITVKIYYTEHSDELFSEEKSFECIPIKKNADIYFNIQRDICKLRIDLYTEAGRNAKIQGIVVNPKNLNIYTEQAIVSFGVPLLVLSAVGFLIFYRTQLKTYFVGLKKYRFLIQDLVSKDIKTKYRRSFLGILWSVLNPLLMMLVTTAVFANIFRFDIKDFPIYYLTGSLIFNFVSDATSFSLNAILGSSGLIKKVYIPKYIFPLEKCLFSFVNMMFSFVAVVIVFLILQLQPHWTILLFPIPMIYAFIFALGLGLVLATLNVFFRDTGHLWGVFVTAWMYVTPIIYPISILPGWVANIVKMNPMYYYVEYFRNVMIYGNIPSFIDNMVCITFSLITLLIGLIVFKKNQDKFILYI